LISTSGRRPRDDPKSPFRINLQQRRGLVTSLSVVIWCSRLVEITMVVGGRKDGWGKGLSGVFDIFYAVEVLVNSELSPLNLRLDSSLLCTTNYPFGNYTAHPRQNPHPHQLRPDYSQYTPRFSPVTSRTRDLETLRGNSLPQRYLMMSPQNLQVVFNLVRHIPRLHLKSFGE